MTTLTATDRAMLALLSNDPQRPGHLGSMLWNAKVRTPAAYARPAGRVLRRLETAGLARWVMRGEDFGWIRT